MQFTQLLTSTTCFNVWLKLYQLHSITANEILPPLMKYMKPETALQVEETVISSVGNVSYTKPVLPHRDDVIDCLILHAGNGCAGSKRLSSRK